MNTIYDYLRKFSGELEQRVMETFIPIHEFSDPLPPELSRLRRRPLPAQAITIAGIAKGWNEMTSIKLVGECGTGKTFVSMSSCFVHARGKRHTTVVYAPPHILSKWCKETLLTIPNARTFIVHDFRNGGDKSRPHGIQEVALVNGKIRRRGWHGSLSDLRAMGRNGWAKLCPQPAYFIVGRETGKLSYYWKHAYVKPTRGKYMLTPVNPDTGTPVYNDDGGRLLAPDFDNKKIFETVKRSAGGNTLYSPLWSADRSRIVRCAPLDFIGRYMKNWFDYAIADEVHELAGDTAQGNGLAVLQRAAKRIIALSGTMSSGYADSMFQPVARLDAPKLVRDGFTIDAEGKKAFQATFGVIEEIKKYQDSDNKCSDAAKPSIRIKRKPGTSPLLFGKYMLSDTAFLYLEDISDALPDYTESVIPVEMGEQLASVYANLEQSFKDAIRAFPKGKGSIASLMLNTLMLYPDHPYGFDEIRARVWDGEEFVYHTIATPPDLPQDVVYPKEQTLLDEVKAELSEGRRCMVYCTYTGRRDMTLRLSKLLRDVGVNVAVLRASVPTDKREAWIAARVAEGVQVVVCHPKLVMTGLDLLDFSSLLFFESGFSLHVLRQASRRSWRIGQKHPVRVKFLTYSSGQGTAQEKCLRLMGRKTAAARALEGQMDAEALAEYGEDDDDLLTALARELVEDVGIGESASDVWKSLARERERTMGGSSAYATALPVASAREHIDTEDNLLELVGDQPDPMVAEMAEWNTAIPVGGQLALFG